MKNKIFIIASVLMAASTLFSCKKLLDTQPRDFLAPEQYFKTESDLNAALAGVYSSLAQDGTFGRNLCIELEMGNDEGNYNNRNNTNSVPSLYDCQSSTKIYADCWTALYQGIDRANLLISNVDSSNVSQTVKNNIKGEALFLRAFNYFQLVTRFGDVPLLLVPTTRVISPNYPRTASLIVYNQIVADMKAAEPLVKDVMDASIVGNTGTRVSTTVVEGILARVYLKMAGHPLMLGIPAFDSARTYAQKVISSGAHQLNASYKQVFINQSSDAYDNTYRESMWEIEFIGNNTPQGVVPPGSRFACQLAMRYTGTDANPVVVYGYGSYVPTGVLYNIYKTYSSDTLRRNWNMPEYTYSSNTSPRTATNYAVDASSFERDCGKWKRDYEVVIPKQRDWGPTNFPILRYADVLLMAAEAENEVNGPVAALPLINLVRSRAKAANITAVMAPNRGALASIIYDERARELCFEGLRKFDLIRWGKLKERMDFTKAAISASSASSTNKTRFLGAYNNVKLRDTLLPIPSVEMTVNNLMTQNAGW